MNCGKCGALLPPELEKLVMRGGPCFCYSCMGGILTDMSDAIVATIKKLAEPINDVAAFLLPDQDQKRPEVDDLIDNVIPEFCDEYCRFPREHIVDFMADDSAIHSSMECTNCPMIKINTFLEDLKNGKQQ